MMSEQSHELGECKRLVKVKVAIWKMKFLALASERKRRIFNRTRPETDIVVSMGNAGVLIL
jgi:hypothetical protein